MIHGVVTTDREPVVQLHVRGPGGQELAVDFVVDTGFTGALVLPASVVAAFSIHAEGRRSKPRSRCAAVRSAEPSHPPARHEDRARPSIYVTAAHGLAAST